MICAHFTEARFLEELTDEIPVRLELLLYSANLEFSMKRFEAYLRSRNRRLTSMVKSINGFNDQAPRRVLMHLSVIGERLYNRRAGP